MADATTYTKILYYGNYADLPAAADRVDGGLYFCVDNGKLYRGTVDFSDHFKTVTSSTIPSAQNAVPGFIYYESDTQKFKTLLGGALVPIGTPLDAAGDSTVSTITISSTDDHTPSTKNVWLYGQEILAQATGGSAVVKSVTQDQTTAGAIIVTQGDDSTSQVVVKGIVKSVAADATNSAAFIITDTEDATTKVTLAGVVTTPTWDETSLKLTLPVVGGTDVEVNIPKDIFLDHGYYDTTNKKIVLVLNDASSTVIEFSVSDLIPIYVAGDTSTIDQSITWDATNGQYVISADAKISDATNNVLTYDATGLFVDGSQFATTSQLETLETSFNNLAEVAGWTSFTA